MGEDAFDADLFSHGPGRALVVSGDHDDFDTHLFEPGNRVDRRRLDRIGNRQEPEQTVVLGYEDRCLSRCGELLCPLCEIPAFDAVIFHQLQVADKRAPTCDRPDRSPAAQRFEPLDGIAGDSVFRRPPDDRLRDWMLGMPLQSGRQPKQHITVATFNRHDVGDSRLAGRDRAGLVEQDGLDAVGRLQRLAVLDEDAVLGPFSHCDHHGRWRRQPERTRASHNQHANCPQHCLPEGIGRPSDVPPHQKRDRCNSDHGRYEVSADAIGEPGDRSFGALCVLHQPDDPLQHGFIADLLGPELEAAGLIQSAADHFIARLLVDGQRFAGDHRFVDRRIALQYRAVDRDSLTRPHNHAVTCQDVVDGNIPFGAVADHPGKRRLHVEQLIDGKRRLPLGPLFQQPAEQDEHRDHRSRLVMDRRGLAEPLPEERRRQAGHERRSGPQGDQRVHVGPTNGKRLRRRREERQPGPTDDRCRQRQQQPIDAGKLCIGHAEDCHGQRQRGGDQQCPQSPPKRPTFSHPQPLPPGPVLGNLRVPVTDAFNRLAKPSRVRPAGLVQDPGLRRGQVYAGRVHAGQSGENLLDLTDTAGAVHAFDEKPRFAPVPVVVCGRGGCRHRACQQCSATTIRMRPRAVTCRCSTSGTAR